MEVSNFKSSWADHFNMPKEYFDQEKPPTINVLVKLLSRTQAPSSASPEVAGGHIDALTSPRHGVAWCWRDGKGMSSLIYWLYYVIPRYTMLYHIIYHMISR